MATYFIRKSVVMERLGFKATALNSVRHNDPTFPKPIFPLGTKTPMFVLDEIEAWQAQRMAAREVSK